MSAARALRLIGFGLRLFALDQGGSASEADQTIVWPIASADLAAVGFAHLTHSSNCNQNATTRGKLNQTTFRHRRPESAIADPSS